jgi:hypothetical protein
MPDDFWVVGDVQGYADPLLGVLRNAGLVDAQAAWSGGKATLIVLGDLVDRGPDGIGVIELLMRLEQEAERAGGRLQVVIGNHDVLLMGARKFPSLIELWQLSGGIQSDMQRLSHTHVRWLRELPAVLLEGDTLLLHADALFYLRYGASVAEVNGGFAEILRGDDLEAWNRLLSDFTEHRAFSGPGGCSQLRLVFDTFGGRRLVHGHTPIMRVTRQYPETVTTAYVYCDGRAVNVDPGIYLGGPGFCFRL